MLLFFRKEDSSSLFLLVSILFGTAFCIAIPPLAGGNETFNFGRAVGIAYGQLLVGDVRVPGGLVQMIAAARRQFTESSALPLGVTGAYLHTLAHIPLAADAPDILPANPIAVLNPLAYAPQAAIIRLGCVLGWSPLAVFYAARITGLACAIALTYLAIRRIPTHRFVLAAIALLPPLSFARSTIDADQLTVSLSLLFVASLWRALLRQLPASRAEFLGLAVLSFLVAQCKSAYFPVPMLALALPATRFAGGTHRLAWLAAIILPGLVCNLAYAHALRVGYFAHAAYHTWAGDADPAAQAAFILHAPLGYAAVLLRTLFATPLIPSAVSQMFGTFGPPVSLPAGVVALLAALFACVALTDPTSRLAYPLPARLLAAAIAALVPCIALSLLYLQWNAVGAPVIAGFQGRYLYPVLLLPLMPLRATRASLAGLGAAWWLTAFAFAGLGGALWLSLWAYYTNGPEF